MYYMMLLLRSLNPDSKWRIQQYNLYYALTDHKSPEQDAEHKSSDDSYNGRPRKGHCLLTMAQPITPVALQSPLRAAVSNISPALDCFFSTGTPEPCRCGARFPSPHSWRLPDSTFTNEDLCFNLQLGPVNFLQGPLSPNPVTRLSQMLARSGIVVSLLGRANSKGKSREHENHDDPLSIF